MIIKQWLFTVRKHFQNYLASINLAGFTTITLADWLQTLFALIER